MQYCIDSMRETYSSYVNDGGPMDHSTSLTGSACSHRRDSVNNLLLSEPLLKSELQAQLDRLQDKDDLQNLLDDSQTMKEDLDPIEELLKEMYDDADGDGRFNDNYHGLLNQQPIENNNPSHLLNMPQSKSMMLMVEEPLQQLTLARGEVSKVTEDSREMLDDTFDQERKQRQQDPIVEISIVKQKSKVSGSGEENDYSILDSEQDTSYLNQMQ